MLEINETINGMVHQLSILVGEVTRITREVGGEGRFGGQVEVAGVQGAWRDVSESFNVRSILLSSLVLLPFSSQAMADYLTNQLRSISFVTKAIAQGDLTIFVEAGASGEMLELKDTVNGMVSQFSILVSEVTRITQEVGTEGKFGGKAEVEGLRGSWKDLKDNVNTMAQNVRSSD
jgi:methyl-accepting chemotaxis protein